MTGYYLDLSEFSLEKLQHILENIRVLPSQQILLEGIETRFATLRDHGYTNLEQLVVVLKTKKQVSAFSEQTGLPLEYVTILRREVNSYLPKPINLKDFTWIDQDSISRIEEIGIKNTLQFFPRIRTKKERNTLTAETGIQEVNLEVLTKLTDVARLKWVGPKFAHLLVESDYDTVEKIANADPEDFYAHIMQINKEKAIYKGGLGLEDTRMWIEHVVRDVPLVIEY